MLSFGLILEAPMRNIILAAASVTFVATLTISTAADALTKSQCNAAYSGCLAKCGNRPGSGTAAGEALTSAQKACFNDCKYAKYTCSKPPYHVPRWPWISVNT